MIRIGEEELICDFAETYHIYNYRGLPAMTAAVLAAGLRDDSRIKMKAIGANAPSHIMLLASIADSLHYLVWSKTKDGSNGRNRPKSILESMVQETKKHRYKVRTMADFKKRYEKRMGRKIDG